MVDLIRGENRVNTDSIELLRLFNEEGVGFLIVGAHAVASHAEPRLTKDLCARRFEEAE